MPRLSDSMEEGTILAWLVADGEPVERGDELCEIETDKANMVYEADLDGVLSIVVSEGETVAVGVRIAVIGERSGESPSDGREPALESRGEAAAWDLTRLQQTVATRMAESKATAPEFVLAVEVEMDRVTGLRAQLKERADDRPVPSLNDFVIKASALALTECPRANASYRDGRFELYSRVNVGMAVATDDALVVPTIFDADRKSVDQIAADTRALAGRVRTGTVTAPELSGGTFTVSNLGMFGIDDFIAVINPPQAAILAVGAIRPTPVARDGAVAIGSVLRLSLSCDHRILYGADAAQFLNRIREHLERPEAMASPEYAADTAAAQASAG